MYRVVVSLGLGSLEDGFKSVSLTLIDPEGRTQLKRVGSLPANRELIELHHRWTQLYRAYYIQAGPSGYRLEFLPDEENPYYFSSSEFQDCCDRLQYELNQWLNFPDFASITNQLRSRLHHRQCFQWIIESNESLIQRLPWHLWSFFQDYPLADIALSLPEFEQLEPFQYESRDKLKVLVILGKSVNDIGDEINVHSDRKIIDETPQVSAKFINRTTRDELRDLLWESHWEIILFAGHSSGEGRAGEAGFLIDTVDDNNLVTIQDLKPAFQEAIKRGLKLVIFNSCDSFGLGLELMRLNLPLCIAMGEAIPDTVAQRFLRYLIQQWHEHDSFVVAVRNARTRLKESEDSIFPCASWLPIVCQNPAALPPAWPASEGKDTKPYALYQYSQVLPSHPQPSPSLPSQSQTRRFRQWFQPLLIGVGILGLICGARWTGRLEVLELKAFDKFHQLSPAEPVDPNILLITVSEADIQYQDQQKMPRKGSLSDVALGQVLEKLQPLEPRAIAVDIFHDFEYSPAVKKNIQATQNFIAICEIGGADDEQPSISMPPSLSTEQVGFSDVVIDQDDVIRRQFLRLADSSACPTDFGLGLKLAQAYLGKTVSGPNKKGELTFDSLRLPRLTHRAGGYNMEEDEASGYQIMTRYRRKEFNHIPLREILAGTNPQKFQELAEKRLIIIGIKQRSRDALHTPVSTNINPQGKLTGMEVHAHMASQLIQAVENGRSLIWWWPEWIEYLWIGFWVMIGVMVSYFVRNPIASFCLLAGTTMVTVVVSFGVFITGGWIPFVPVILGLSLLLIGSVMRLWFKQFPAPRWRP